jgi:hypothetical protein
MIACGGLLPAITTARCTCNPVACGFAKCLGHDLGAAAKLENTNLLERRIDAEQVAFNMENGARDEMNLHATINSHAARLLELTGSWG